jgi:hypothetical protein
MTLISNGTGAIYKCGKCGGTFSSGQAANEHRENCAGNNDPQSNGGSGSNPDDEHTCGICNQVFSSSSALTGHALRCHRDTANLVDG